MEKTNSTNLIEDYKYIFKIILVGDSGVGKTNLLSRLTNKGFSTELHATIGVEFSSVSFKIGDDNIKAHIWDTAGQERYRAITSSYYRGTFGALIVFDLSRRKSLTELFDHWLIRLREFSSKDMVIMLVGNKCDLEKQREVKREEALKLAEENDLVYFETSALSGENVNKVFYELIKSIYEKNRIVTLPEAKKKIDLKEKEVEIKSLKKKKKNSCC